MEHDGSVLGTRTDADLLPRPGMCDGIACELEHRLNQPLPVSHDTPQHIVVLCGGVERPSAIGERSGFHEHLVDDFADVETLQSQEPRRRRLRQRLHVVDDASHAVELVEHDGARGLIARLHQLQVSARDRQRCAQLVAGVVDECSLRGEARCEPVEHVVERAGQLVDLIAGRGLVDGNPPREIGLADLAGGLGDMPQWREHMAGNDPADRCGDRERDRPQPQQPAHRLADGGCLGIGEDRDDEPAVSVVVLTGDDGRGDEADASGVSAERHEHGLGRIGNGREDRRVVVDTQWRDV